MKGQREEEVREEVREEEGEVMGEEGEAEPAAPSSAPTSSPCLPSSPPSTPIAARMVGKTRQDKRIFNVTARPKVKANTPQWEHATAGAQRQMYIMSQRPPHTTTKVSAPQPQRISVDTTTAQHA